MKANKVMFFSEMLEKNKRVFKAPVYQRNYNWTKFQFEKIYKDILLAGQKNIQHFIGTIVYINDNYGGSGLNTILIIDGQQRLTTLYILLKVLLDIAKNKKEADIENEINDVIFNKNSDEKNKIKLKSIESDDNQLVFLFDNEIDKMNINSNIYKAYMSFNQMVKSSLNNNFKLVDILNGIKQLEVVEIILDKLEGDNPQKIFESINSTGLELNLSDLIRNYLLMDAKKQEILYKTYWQDIEKNVGYNNLTEFVIHYVNSEVNKFANKRNAYQLFKDNCEKKDLSSEEVLLSLKQKSKYFGSFLGKNNFYDKTIQYYLNSFYLIKQCSVVPFLFKILDDYENNNISKDTLIKVLNYLLSYNIRLVIVENTKNLNKQMQSLYSRTINDNYDNYYEKIAYFLNNLKSNDRMPKDNEFKNALINKEVYKKNVCKFILSSIENSSKEKLDVSNLNIEHILPQKENAILWKKELGDEYKKIYDNLLHTIGNLTITGYNSELGTKPFNEKQKIIEENSKAKILNKDVLNVKVWNYENIINRSKNLADILIKQFYYDEVIYDDNKKLIKCNINEEIDLSNTIPVSFEFETILSKTKSWADLLNKLMEYLYQFNKETLFILSKKGFSLEKAKNTYISWDKKVFRRAKEIMDTGIYFETNLSSNNIITFIRNLLKTLNYDLENFNIYIKDKKHD